MSLKKSLTYGIGYVKHARVLGLVEDVNHLDFTPNWKGVSGGGFGIPWSYRATEIAKKIQAGLKNGITPSDEDLKVVENFAKLRLDIEEDQIKDPLSFHWRLRGWEPVYRYWPKADIILVLGGNRACLGGNTLIYDPVARVSRKIAEIDTETFVEAVDPAGNRVVAKAGRPFEKGVDDIYKVKLSTGETFETAPSHLVYTAYGYLPISALRVGASLFLPPTTSDNARPGQIEGVHRSIERALDSRFYCPACCGLCDEQLRALREVCRESVPLPDDVRERTSFYESNPPWNSFYASDLLLRKWDARGNTLLDNQMQSGAFRQPSLGDPFPLVGRFFGTLYRGVCKLCISASQLFGNLTTLSECRRCVDESSPRKFSALSSQRGSEFDCVLPYSFAVIESIEWVRTDVKWDMSVPAYNNYIAQGAIHHNSKSFGASNLCTLALWQLPAADIFAFHQDMDLSKEVGQRTVYEALPFEINGVELKARRKTKGKNFSLDWTQKNGFSGDVCILPPRDKEVARGSMMTFFTYNQFLLRPDKMEGLKGDIFWLDEEGPYGLFNTLRQRRGLRPKKILLTATPLKGQTETVRFITEGAEILESRYSEFLGKKLPIVKKSRTVQGAYIFYLWTQDNPFNDWDATVRDLSGLSSEEQMTRAFGIPKVGSQGAFPKWSPMVHVVKESDVPVQDCTNYLFVDPAGDKPWFMVWVRVDKDGRHWVYREWPDKDTYGSWAVPKFSEFGLASGSKGPAQQSEGYGFEFYADLIHEHESKEPIAECYMDARFANQGRAEDEGISTVSERMADKGVYFLPSVGENKIGPGIQMVNDLLNYDVSKPVSSSNRPMLLVSEACGNVIEAMSNYTFTESRVEYKDSYKDPVDCVRYAAQASLLHLGSVKNLHKGGHW